ncbi:hypothetical protein EDB87DRAFT_1610849 [Lactarius vividus]|nr:hypothetical protein EDB87DRAFT_1610849 [Lactarius vividus]
MSPPPVYPRITYQTEGRTFDRLFKEHSLQAAKAVVRKKLGLGHDALIELTQLRDGKTIDLEDDDDFEAFRALTNSSLHAIVAVTIPSSGSSTSANSLGEKRRRPNELTQETYLQGGAESSVSASITGSPTVQSPGIHVTDTRRPRKRRKVAFSGDLVTSETALPAQPPPLSGNDVGHSPPNPALASTFMASQSSKTTERTKSSTQAPTTNTGKPKSNVVRATHQDDGEAVVSPETSRKRGKKKDDPLQGREPLPDQGRSGRGDISPAPETQVKRVRKKAKKVALEPAAETDAVPTDGQHEQPQEVVPVIADASLREVVSSDIPKQEKTKPVKAKGGVKKSKSGLVDPAENEMIDSTETLKRKVPKKKVRLEVSTTGAKDDIDRTITALLNRRMQADPKTSSDPVTEIELAVPSRSDVLSVDPPLTGVWKRSRLKASLSQEENQRPSKPRRPLASQEIVEQDTTLATTASFKETATAGLHPTSDHHTISDSVPVRRKNPVHTLEDRSAVEGTSSISAHIAQTEVNGDFRLVASEESTITLRALTGSDQSVPSRFFSAASTSRVPFPGRSTSGEGSRTGANPTIPEGLVISGVPIKARGEGSSDESSSEDEDEEAAVPLTKPGTSIADLSIPMDLLQDQLVALIRGPDKGGPCRSILDEIPSSSETGSESSPEDLMLDEEEDLSRQPPRKQKLLSTSRLSSIEPEPEPTSEDDGSASSHVFMDTPNEVPHYLPHSATSQVEDASADANAERGASEHPDIDTSTERALKGQDISGSVQTPSGKGHASDTQPGTNTPRTTSPESDATVINTDPAKPHTPAPTEQLSGRVLVPASSPFVTKALVNAGEKVQTQDEIDDVEPADESTDGDKESDPIEPEPNEPSVDLPAPRLSTDPVSRHLRRPASRATLDPSSELEQPSRRSDRLANRRTSLAISEATPALARRPDRKASVSLKKSATKENHERTHNGMVEETTQEISTRKQVSKGRKLARQTTQRSTNPDETLVQERGSAQASNSQVEWTTLAPSETPADGSSPIDELRTSSPGPMRQLLPVGDDASRSADLGEDTPMPIRRGVKTASQGKGGRGQPLFFPGSSQAPRTQTAPPPSASESEAENVASALPRKTPTMSTPGSGMFRSLSGLASQDILFPKMRAAKRVFNNTPSRKVKGPFPEDDDDEDDEESSSSSDDTGEVPKSHIPKERRVGTTPRRKGGRLSSLAKLVSYSVNDA